jgi:hypothetical protein
MSGRSKETFVFADHDSGGIIHVANIKGGERKRPRPIWRLACESGKTLIIDLDVQGMQHRPGQGDRRKRPFLVGIAENEDDDPNQSLASNRPGPINALYSLN